MKRLWTLLMVSGFAVTGFAAGDEEAIQNVISELAMAFNQGDAKGVAQQFAEDADLVDPKGKMAKGRAEIEALVNEDINMGMKGRTHSCSLTDVRFLKPDVAVVNAVHEAAGPADGSMGPPLKALVTGVLQKKGGQWLWVAARPMVPFTPPKEEAHGLLDGTEWVVGEKGSKKADSLVFGNQRFTSTSCIPWGFYTTSYTAQTKGAKTSWKAVCANAKGEKMEWWGDAAGSEMAGGYTHTKANGKSATEKWTAKKI